MSRKIVAPDDLRRTALRRAGFAVMAAIALLLGTLWYEDAGMPMWSPPAKTAPPPAASEADTPPVYAIDAAASDEAIVPVDEIVASAADASVPMAPEAAPGETGNVPEAVVSQPEPPAAGRTLDVAAKTPPPSLQDAYFLQLGVFDSMDNAKSLLENALASGLPAHLQARVVVGPFRNKREAESARRRLGNIAEGIVLPPRKTGKVSAEAARKSKRRAAK
ncbi:MAG: SPOR domain-containing protein [Azoarcus sp.]|jgi:cell division septation protein DedD|nr:SPOR domain-containing protein [Azoarcus sp.]